MVSGVELKNVDIEDLEVDVDQITRLMIDGKQVMGPAGDVFDWKRNVGPESEYVGTVLSDAQIAVGAFKKYLTTETEISAKEVTYFFGATHMPDSVMEWASKEGQPWE